MTTVLTQTPVGEMMVDSTLAPLGPLGPITTLTPHDQLPEELRDLLQPYNREQDLRQQIHSCFTYLNALGTDLRAIARLLIWTLGVIEERRLYVHYDEDCHSMNDFLRILAEHNGMLPVSLTQQYLQIYHAATIYGQMIDHQTREHIIENIPLDNPNRAALLHTGAQRAQRAQRHEQPVDTEMEREYIDQVLNSPESDLRDLRGGAKSATQTRIGNVPHGVQIGVTRTRRAGSGEALLMFTGSIAELSLLNHVNNGGAFLEFSYNGQTFGSLDALARHLVTENATLLTQSGAAQDYA